MKKVCTLTFSNSKSHGALLQCYALHEFLIRSGYPSEVLNYCPEYFHGDNTLFPLQSGNIVKGLIKDLLLLKYRWLLKQKFAAFKKEYISFTKPYYRIEDLQTDTLAFAAFIVGSDQIWNPDITHGLDDVFLLKFVSPAAMKLSYGASTGIILKDEAVIKKLNEGLHEFHSILLREHNVMDVLDDQNADKADIVCDPVFLLDPLEWDKKTVKVDRKRYVLIYNLVYDKRLYDAAVTYADAHDLDIIDVARCEIRHPYSRAFRSLVLSPMELISYIRHASYVFTSSFHGVCFCLLFEKEFKVLLPENRKGRVKELLSRFQLETCDLSIHEQIEAIDYQRVRKEIQIYSDASREALLKVLGEI